MPGVALASQNEADVALRLRREGFSITLRQRTLLGRIRFQARKGQVFREVVMDPASGEILRDYSEDIATELGSDTRGSGTSGSSGGGGTGGETGGEGAGGGEPGSGEPAGGESGGGEPEGDGEKKERDRVKR